MQILQSELDLDRFFQTVRAASQRALLLDYDGTLAPFRVERTLAAPYPGIRETLNTIARAGHTRLVIISGRAAHELLPLLGLDQRPEIWGSHGWERLQPDGRYTLVPLGTRQATGLSEARAWCEQQGLLHCCEDKPASVAVHWRGLVPRAAESLRGHVVHAWSPLAKQAGLTIAEFDGGIELRAPGRDKGIAVQTVLAELGAGAAIAYLGDDLTDEDAFRAIRSRGLSVLVRSEWRATTADLWLRPPEELLAFLTRWQRGGAYSICQND
jgi:trehalose-phosphatase